MFQIFFFFYASILHFKIFHYYLKPPDFSKRAANWTFNLSKRWKEDKLADWTVRREVLKLARGIESNNFVVR